MSSVLSQLTQLAAAAEIHARERHQITLQRGDWDQVDLILSREREAGATEERESLSLCYGAWLGESLISAVAAEWVGLHEPIPPRVRISGICYSPIDAVQRRLTSSLFPSIPGLVRQLLSARTAALLPRSDASPEKQDLGQQDFPQVPPKSFHQAGIDPVEFNRAAWNRRADDPAFTASGVDLPPTPDEIRASLDPWLADRDLAGAELLCLAAAGGTHGPLYAAAGARVTVVDFSPALLAVDQEMARRFQLELKTVQADLCDLSPLTDRQFDVIIQPVSTCYIPNLEPMIQEIFRVLKPGGIYLSQHKSPVSLQSNSRYDAREGYAVVHPSGNGLLLPAESPSAASPREPEMMEYVHSLDELLGGLCRNGFILEAVAEPVRGDAWAPRESAAYRAVFLPPYLKLLARRPE